MELASGKGMNQAWGDRVFTDVISGSSSSGPVIWEKAETAMQNRMADMTWMRAKPFMESGLLFMIFIVAIVVVSVVISVVISVVVSVETTAETGTQDSKFRCILPNRSGYF